MCCPDDAVKKPEDSNYTVDVLTRCVVSTNGVAKKTLKIVPLKEPGEPVIVSISISQVKCLILFSCLLHSVSISFFFWGGWGWPFLSIDLFLPCW
jgi:hypothetical protein